MSAYVFAAAPPFRPLRISARPLLFGSCKNPVNPEPLSYWQPIVVFPAGAIRRGATWYVSAGVNDFYTTLIEIPQRTLEDTLVSSERFLRSETRCFGTTRPRLVPTTGCQPARWMPAERRHGSLVAVMQTDDPVTIAALSEDPHCVELPRHDLDSRMPTAEARSLRLSR